MSSNEPVHTKVTATIPQKLWDMRNKQIVFHGVNKSGSLALSSVLLEGYRLAGRGSEFYSNYHQPRSIKQLSKLAATAIAPSFFVSHYLFGALPSIENRCWISQFRHPLPRIVSCYTWLKNKHVQKHNSSEGFPSLDGFIDLSEGKAHSQIVQFGVGFGNHARKLRDSLTPKEIYERAKENIERWIRFIGIAEYLEETIFCLAAICCIEKVPLWKRDTRNRARTLVGDLPDSTIARITEVYEYDFMLYQWVLCRFFEQNREVDFGVAFEGYRQACADEYKDRLL